MLEDRVFLTKLENRKKEKDQQEQTLMQIIAYDRVSGLSIGVCAGRKLRVDSLQNTATNGSTVIKINQSYLGES